MSADPATVPPLPPARGEGSDWHRLDAGVAVVRVRARAAARGVGQSAAVFSALEPGGNSGVFVWSSAVPNPQSRLPDGVEVQMLELDWPKLHTKDGVVPPVAYVHGELFGVGGVKTIPDNPRGERSKSIENLCKPRGEWNTYDVVAVDGTIKLSVNGKVVNGISKASKRKGYLCMESEGAKIHFRNIKIMELPPTGSPTAP